MFQPAGLVRAADWAGEWAGQRIGTGGHGPSICGQSVDGQWKVGGWEVGRWPAWEIFQTSQVRYQAPRVTYTHVGGGVDTMYSSRSCGTSTQLRPRG
ncbi:hypothetical protein TWF694_010327 [Orbilia ellipsospora]|uniref:Uncharacterized protein n=1 Tax=Orbilia ellipsospora TaxID=2528407 RepID=A0AAV9X9K4_9PEZI